MTNSLLNFYFNKKMNDLLIGIDKFVKRLEQSNNLDINEFKNIKINIKTSDITNTADNSRCLAIVDCPESKESYQCTRKQKYGLFCGLHYDKKNTFKTMTPNTEIRDIKTFYIILKPVVKGGESSNNQNKTNTDKYLFDFINHEIFRIDYMNNIYRINKNSREIWLEDTDKLIYLGKLEDTKIPIVLY